MLPFNIVTVPENKTITSKPLLNPCWTICSAMDCALPVMEPYRQYRGDIATLNNTNLLASRCLDDN